MSTRTLSARTDLTYEEIYEGYASGKSRLPKMIKQIENGALALAETTGIDIKRRRTKGANANYNASLAGQTNTVVVAKLVSADRLEDLLLNYVGPDADFVTPPSYFLQEVDVRGLVKDTADLIDQVAGVNYSNQTKNAAGQLTGRAAKLKEKGTGATVRQITTLALAVTGATADIDVRDYYAHDRVGGGGATGEVHGIDKTFAPLTATVGAVDDLVEQTIIDLDTDAEEQGTVLRYGTAQFCVLKIMGTTNGLTAPTASAYIVHPDFLEDLIAFQ